MENAVYNVTEIGKDSFCIDDKGVHAYFFIGLEYALLVDTGFGTGNIKEFVETLTDKTILLVNTHADGDHVGCNALFEKAYLHPAEFPYYYETFPKEAEVMPLWDGDTIDIGGRIFEIILIPGHTPGSIALLDRENRILVAGDSISDTVIFMYGTIRSLRAYSCSMKKLLTLSNSFDTVYPAHGPSPLGIEVIERLISGAESILRGEVESEEPPFDMPAKAYKAGGVSFFYDERA